MKPTLVIPTDSGDIEVYATRYHPFGWFTPISNNRIVMHPIDVDLLELELNDKTTELSTTE